MEDESNFFVVGGFEKFLHGLVGGGIMSDDEDFYGGDIYSSDSESGDSGNEDSEYSNDEYVVQSKFTEKQHVSNKKHAKPSHTTKSSHTKPSHTKPIKHSKPSHTKPVKKIYTTSIDESTDEDSDYQSDDNIKGGLEKIYKYLGGLDGRSVKVSQLSREEKDNIVNMFMELADSSSDDSGASPYTHDNASGKKKTHKLIDKIKKIFGRGEEYYGGNTKTYNFSDIEKDNIIKALLKLLDTPSKGRSTLKPDTKHGGKTNKSSSESSDESSNSSNFSKSSRHRKNKISKFVEAIDGHESDTDESDVDVDQDQDNQESPFTTKANKGPKKLLRHKHMDIASSNALETVDLMNSALYGSSEPKYFSELEDYFNS